MIVESALEEVLSEDYTSGGALFIACGGLLIGVSFVGCLGAFFKWRPILLVVSSGYISPYHILCIRVVYCSDILSDRTGDRCSWICRR